MRPVKSRSVWSYCIGLAVLGVLALLAGCGGSNSVSDSTTAGTGSATIAVQWPNNGRAIPEGATRIVIRVFTSSELTSLQREIVRPAQEAQLNNLPLGPVLFVAEARDDQGQLLASGGSTVTIAAGVITPVSLSLSPVTAGMGRAVFVVREVPTSTSRVTARIRQNGAVIPNLGEPPSFTVSGLTGYGVVPFYLASLPAGALLFEAAAYGATDTATAQCSQGVTLTAGNELLVGASLVTISSGNNGGQQPGVGETRGMVVLNVANMAQGDALVVVDPVPGNQALLGTADDPSAILVPLPRSGAGDSLPVSRVPVLVSGLKAGPWLFVVTTHGTLSASAPVSRVGSIVANVQAGTDQTLDVSLSNSQSASTNAPNGRINALITNITAEGVQRVLVAVFDSAGRVDFRDVTHVQGVNERQVSFDLPAGPYTVVAAAYGGPGFNLANYTTALGNRTTIPTGALAVGSKTVSVASGQNTDTNVELRLQGQSGSGSINLAMLNVPVAVEEKIQDNIATYTITSSVLVQVYSVTDNQELTALRQVLVPPSSMLSSDILINPAVGYDQLQPLRLRIDGIPVGDMRFVVTAMRAADGTGAVMGRGSTIATVAATVNPVSVIVLPHGDLPPGVVMPGLENPAPDAQNPAPTRAWSGRGLAMDLWNRAFGRRR